MIWTQHLAWCPIGHRCTRVVEIGQSRIAVVVSDDRVETTPLVGNATVGIDRYHVPPSAPEMLARALDSVDGVLRVRTSDLWEAITVAVCGLTGTDAWSVHKSLCRYFGERVELPSSPRYAMCPTPEVICNEGDLSVAATDLGDVAEILIDAAELYRKYHEEWNRLAPRDLIDALRGIDGVEKSLAGQIVADFTGDFSLYPYSTVTSITANIVPGFEVPADGAIERDLVALLLVRQWADGQPDALA